VKRTVLFLLIFFFSIHSLGLFFVFKLAKWHIHTEVAEKIKQGHYTASLITILSFTKEQQELLEWEKLPMIVWEC